MIVIDTAVLLYAVGLDHPLREPAREVMIAQRAGRIDGATTIEAIQEFVHVYSRRRARADAVALGRDYAAALRFLSAERSDLDLGLQLYVEHPPLGSFDSILAAVALNRGAEAFVTSDVAFGLVPDLPLVPLGSEQLRVLLHG